MRPLRLDVVGFTVFRELTTLDLSGADLFALVGPTGSGKSSLLDAICFALYGTVPRWGKRGGIAGALAPSSTEARVRLIFEASGQRYAASRTVRRVGKAGTPQTSHAGLERLHPDFDISTMDNGLAVEQLGEVLAGSPSEMDSAVLRAVGLPYEQFVTCVLLPQGAFAEFLHATPASRQQILVNLLGLGVYDEIRERAGAQAVEAEAKLGTIDSVLMGEAPTEGALASAATRLDRLRQLAADVDAALPALDEAEKGAASAAAELRQIEEELKALDVITPPVDPATVTTRETQALVAVREAEIEVAAAEAVEEQLLRQRDTASDPVMLAKLLDAYERADEIPAEIERHATLLAAAEEAHVLRASAAEEADRRLNAAQVERDAARDAQLAAALRVHLRVGYDCPVCMSPVRVLPQVCEDSRMAAAERAITEARSVKEETQRELQVTDRQLIAARTKLEEATERQARAMRWFTDKPDRADAATALARAQDLAKQWEAAGVEVRKLRMRRQAAGAELDAARSLLHQAWGDYDRARDAVARFAPPSADRDDLASSWATLTRWADCRSTELKSQRDAAQSRAEATDTALAAASAAITALFTAAEAPSSGQYVADAAIAVERAFAAHHTLVEAAERAARLRTQRDEYERSARVAKTLAQHLNANNFKRWLLTEALDQLVEGASALLLELSGGQYELGHDKGEFYVVDHHDAEQRRGVRTLSGGETFQASLALALALSDRLAGMSTSNAALGSIILDEGFGTLDGTTLDTVAATLENLAARGDRLVGVVTHVPALAERIPIRYEVRKNAQSAFVERVL
jgi:exonuclease SbcC